MSEAKYKPPKPTKQKSKKHIKTFDDYFQECIKSDGQEKSTKILFSWQELKNKFISFFVHSQLLGR